MQVKAVRKLHLTCKAGDVCAQKIKQSDHVGLQQPEGKYHMTKSQNAKASSKDGLHRW